MAYIDDKKQEFERLLQLGKKTEANKLFTATARPDRHELLGTKDQWFKHFNKLSSLEQAVLINKLDLGNPTVWNLFKEVFLMFELKHRQALLKHLLKATHKHHDPSDALAANQELAEKAEHKRIQEKKADTWLLESYRARHLADSFKGMDIKQAQSQFNSSELELQAMIMEMLSQDNPQLVVNLFNGMEPKNQPTLFNKMVSQEQTHNAAVIVLTDNLGHNPTNGAHLLHGLAKEADPTLQPTKFAQLNKFLQKLDSATHEKALKLLPDKTQIALAAKNRLAQPSPQAKNNLPRMVPEGVRSTSAKEDEMPGRPAPTSPVSPYVAPKPFAIPTLTKKN